MSVLFKPKAPAAAPAGRLVVVAGFSGGVGRTTAAANLAAGLAAWGLRVSALDLSLPAPALAVHLGLRGFAPGRWRALAAGESHHAVLVPAPVGEAAGLRLLPGPGREERRDLPAPEALAGLAETLRDEDDAVVADLSPDPDCPYARALAERADAAVFVLTPAPDAAARFRAVLAAPPWGVDRARGFLFVNREDRGHLGVDGQALAGRLGVPACAAAAPYAPQPYANALTGGLPLVLSPCAEGEPWRRLRRAVAAGLGWNTGRSETP